jgi:hypothetical protein
MIRNKLAAVRAKHSLVAVGTGISQAIVIFIACLAVMMIFDRAANVPWFLRLVLLLGTFGFSGWILFKTAILPIVRGPGVEELALKVEGHEPTFRSRLIAAIQWGSLGAIPHGASPSLVRITLEEADTIAAPLNFSRVIKTGYFLKTFLAAFIVLGLGVGIAMGGGDRIQNLIRRAFLSNEPLYTRTRVVDITGADRIAQGETFVFKARAEGYVPDFGLVEVTIGKEKPETYTLTPTKEDKSVFTANLPAVQKDFTYMITLYDGRMPQPQKVQVKLRPVVKTIDYEVRLPAYTGYDPFLHNNQGAITVLPGSTVNVSLTSSKNLVSGTTLRRLVLLPQGNGNPIEEWKDYPMTVSGDEATVTVDIVEKTSRLVIALRDFEGINNKDAAFCTIDVKDDRAPDNVSIIRPEREKIVATRTARIPVEFSATDDYRLGSVVLKYKVDTGPEITVDSGIKDLGRFAQGVITWELAKVQVPVDANGSPTRPALEGSVIKYWVEARDTNSKAKDGPGIGKSNEKYVTIVTEEELRAQLNGQLGESITKIYGFTEEQKNTAEELGKALTNEPAPPEKK